MVTFYICPHGQTEYNLQGRLSGWIDTPLTEAGILNVETSAQKLAGIPINAIHSSDLGRAFVTAYIIARRLNFSEEIVRSSALREVCYGDLAAMPSDLAEKQHPELHTNAEFIPPHGESLHVMQARVLGYIKELADSSEDKTILLTAHDGVIKAIYANYADTDLGIHNSTYGYPNDYVASFTMDNGKVSSFAELTLS